MSIFEAGWSQLIVTMHPFHHRSGTPTNLCGPVGGITLLAANLVQRLKSFPASGMLCFDTEPSEIFEALPPFVAVWS